MNTIEYTGNTERFANQKHATLLSVELQIVKEISCELITHIGNSAIPRGSAILCVFLGDKGVPFAVLKNYGATSMSRLKSLIGDTFAINNNIQPVVQESLVL
jgi:hypothetical protein